MTHEMPDFERRRQAPELCEVEARHAHRLSGWNYARFFAVLLAGCARDGIAAVAVDPAYTSVIGGEKHAPGLAMSHPTARSCRSAARERPG